MSVLKCYCHPLLTALLFAGHSSCFNLLFWQLKRGDFFFPWKLWDTVLKQFSNIDLERVPISFCFLLLCCLNTCKITYNNSVCDSLKNWVWRMGLVFISKYAFLSKPVIMEIWIFKWVILVVYMTVVFRTLNEKMSPFVQCTGYTQRTHMCSEIVFMSYQPPFYLILFYF